MGDSLGEDDQIHGLGALYGDLKLPGTDEPRQPKENP